MQHRALNPPDATLTALFSLCQNDSFAKKLLYTEVPLYYTWNAKKKSFYRRKQGQSVDGQPTIFIFEYLRTVNGTIHYTYPNACQALNLLKNFQYWDNCINDACETSTPSQICALFGIILISCSPSARTELWRNINRKWPRIYSIENG